jgi:hypothetical protein
MSNSEYQIHKIAVQTDVLNIPLSKAKSDDTMTTPSPSQKQDCFHRQQILPLPLLLRTPKQGTKVPAREGAHYPVPTERGTRVRGNDARETLNNVVPSTMPRSFPTPTCADG